MLMTILATVLSLGTAAIQTDTTLKVPNGARLLVNNFAGAIEVRSWDKDKVRVEAEHAPYVQVRVESDGSTIQVRASSRRGVPGHVEYRIQVPGWMPLDLSGVYTDVDVEGAKGEVSAETVKGDVSLKGGEGFVKLSSIQGEVTVAGAKGRMELSAVNEGVNVHDVEGELSVEAVNGDVILEGVRSRMVEAATVNGAVRYLGTILDNGRYRFASHNGDLDIAVPQNVNANVSVATFNGEFESAFPIVLSESGKVGKRFSFRLGNGSAAVELETFQGTINLRRLSALEEKEK